ncbi:MAG TPA: DEAD/DEAH box helicase [Aestuariivirga sp.]|jgi:superfamily II DNA/RNA helicase|nr:DEAD/DEAH box helicase [Hyphomicrobiales bacterium]MBP9173266.1 DEAD/DEAH box helicase [Hyphomicrobiales bacterium]MCC7481226.1 DEAD/DEAH box helicase [Hyphomicrobiales bacterium]HQY72418.1 DEAD/DEAH box helicase [Aestuariivirga sp.]
MNFSELGLSPKVLEAISAAGYTTPTTIQAEAIPHALQRKDVLGLAQTGSGKTAAFVLPMLTLLEKGRARARMPRTLILEPTRELAAQVHEAFETLGKQHKLTVALLIGGVAFEPQAAKINRGADVVIATPGRLLDHMERGGLLLTGIEMLVIDEADRMLDMGFIPDIEKICKLLPFTRQTMFFSATMPPEIHRLTTQFLHNPVRIEASAPSSTAASIEQYLVKVPHDAAPKRDALRALLRTQTKVKNGIVFANRKTTVALLEKSLRKHGFSAGALHGDMDQSARLKMLAAFRNNEVTYLIASDVAARGLDIPEVSHVFNFDVPIHAEDYVHRVGRTGRAGREGHAFTMVTREEAKYLRAIETLINKEIPYFDIGTVEDSGDAPEKEQRSARGGRKPGRHREKPADRAPAAKMPAAAKPVAARPAVEQPIAEKPAPQAKPPRQPEQRRARPERELEDAPESGGFHKGNMPAFLLRK